MKFDTYTLKARTAPFVLVILPLPAAVVAWYPEQLLTWRSLVGAGVTVFLTALLAQLGRDRGKKKEAALFASWGGKPTTQLLRHSYTCDDNGAAMRRRQRNKLAKLYGEPFPTSEAEERDPKTADAMYEAAVSFLRERTRDTSKFWLINKENTNYGYRRNLWGLRIPAAILALLSAAASFGAAYFSPSGNGQITAVILGAFITAAFLLYVFGVTPNWVRVTAFEYAKQLLAAVETLDEATPDTTTTPRILKP